LLFVFLWCNLKFGGNSMKKPEITILWGNDKVKKTYVFEDETQKAFFMKGVDEAEGWLKYEVVENEQL